jgi:hypothetical protein
MTTTIRRIRIRPLGRSHDQGRLVRIQTTVRDSAVDASRILHDPRSRKHQRAAARHLQRAARRAQRIGVGRAVDDGRVKVQLALGYRHLMAAKEAPHRRMRRRVLAGGVLTGLVVGGAAAGIARTRSSSSSVSLDGGDAEAEPTTNAEAEAGTGPEAEPTDPEGETT